jgi:hypothetical protein
MQVTTALTSHDPPDQPRLRVELKIMRSWRVLLATILLLLFSAHPAVAGTRTSDVWRSELREIDGLLRAGKYEPAKLAATRLLREMVHTAGLGRGAAYSLAVACAFRALGEMGTGDQEAAIWSWHTALNLFPDIALTDLGPYGAPGAALRGLKLREPTPDQMPSLEPGVEDVERPKRRKTPPPDYPQALLDMSKQGTYVVEAVIGYDGKPRFPVLLTPVTEPAMAYVVLDTLRTWEFEPARLQGKAVPVWYTLTVNFVTRQ